MHNHYIFSLFSITKIQKLSSTYFFFIKQNNLIISIYKKCDNKN